MKLVHAGFSHVGMRRENNEDAFAIVRELKLFLVADGMGGHNSGEIASQMAIETMVNFFKATELDDEITWPYRFNRKKSVAENRLLISIRLANSRIHDCAQRNSRYHRMGTTIVGGYFEDNVLYYAHVGDSRLYRLRRGTFEQLSEDHSLLNDMIRRKGMTPEEIENFPHRNVIVRALGIKEQVEVDSHRLLVEPDDIFLFCTDGLSNMLSDAEMRDLVMTTPDIPMAVNLLIREANQRGGDDNITVILVQAAEL